MLTDTKLRSLKAGPRAYKVVDRDGLYAMVLASGVVSFRFNYRINGRQETLVLGCYGPDGLTLAEAREKLIAARKLVAAGMSPTQHKRRQKQRREGEESFGEWAERWLEKYRMAESTRDMRRSVYERDLARPFGKLLLHEITHEELRALCAYSGQNQPVIPVQNQPSILVQCWPVIPIRIRPLIPVGYRHTKSYQVNWGWWILNDRRVPPHCRPTCDGPIKGNAISWKNQGGLMRSAYAGLQVGITGK